MNEDNKHIDDFQIKALNKLVNSGIIHNIYPMIDNIDVEVTYLSTMRWGAKPIITLIITLNDSKITSENIWETEFDPFYLVDKYLRELLPYIGIDNNTTVVKFKAYSPEGKFIYEG